MDGLIEVRKESIGGNEVNAVNARDFHAFLESKQQFADWIKSRIEKHGFMEGIDFIVFHNFMKNPQGGRATNEYTISLDMAKQLAMLERGKKGKMARLYFIECERRLNEIQRPTAIQADPVWLQEAQATLKFGDLLGMPKHIIVGETAKRVRMLDGPDFTSHIGALPSSQNILPDEMMLEPTPLGRMFGLSAVEMNRRLAEWGWQYRPDGATWTRTQQGEPYSSVHYWAKNNKTGYNLKWNVESVREKMRDAGNLLHMVST